MPVHKEGLCLIALVREEKGRPFVLLMPGIYGKLKIPGGEVEEKESVLDAAHRECKDEIGVTPNSSSTEVVATIPDEHNPTYKRSVALATQWIGEPRRVPKLDSGDGELLQPPVWVEVTTDFLRGLDDPKVRTVTHSHRALLKAVMKVAAMKMPSFYYAARDAQLV